MKNRNSNSDASFKLGSSYGHILRSSSIIGGAQGINYLIGMVRTKLVAVLLGPSGVGLVSLYMSGTGLVGTLAGLGIASSGVREVAEAHGTGDPERVARIIKTLRRACWATGLLGWILTAAFSYPLSLWAFGSNERACIIALLGVTVFIGAVSGGQGAILQGTRRIGDLARLNVLGASAGTVIALGLYAWLGEKGIVPVLITTAAVNLTFSWWFARKVKLIYVSQSFTKTCSNSKRLVGLGLAFMWGALLASGVALAIRGLIARELGLDANGIYQAAWGISGMFAGFILGAMGTDFYPRLTAVAHDNTQVNRLVNEQTEIGIFLALPGLMGTLAFAPWFMHIFYTSKFIAGADLLPWFVLGIFCRVTSWPMGFIQLAKGASRWFAITQSLFAIMHFCFTLLFLKKFGLTGVAPAFALAYGLHVCSMFWVANRLSGFRWSEASVRLLLVSITIVGGGFAVQRWIPRWPGLALGGGLAAASAVLSLRGIASRLGAEHRLVKLACRLPGGKFACGI